MYEFIWLQLNPREDDGESTVRRYWPKKIPRISALEENDVREFANIFLVFLKSVFIFQNENYKFNSKTFHQQKFQKNVM